MYVAQVNGPPYWNVCQDDGAILNTFRSKSAATRWMRDMQDAERGSYRVDRLPSAPDWQSDER